MRLSYTVYFFRRRTHATLYLTRPPPFPAPGTYIIDNHRHLLPDTNKMAAFSHSPGDHPTSSSSSSTTPSVPLANNPSPVESSAAFPRGRGEMVAVDSSVEHTDLLAETPGAGGFYQIRRNLGRGAFGRVLSVLKLFGLAVAI